VHAGNHTIHWDETIYSEQIHSPHNTSDEADDIYYVHLQLETYTTLKTTDYK